MDIDILIGDAALDVITKCTLDGALDEGCVLECAFLGDDACSEYIDVVADAVVVAIPEPPTAGPTSGPTSAPTKGPNPNRIEIGGEDEVETTDAGSNGDPHCKSSCHPFIPFPIVKTCANSACFSL